MFETFTGKEKKNTLFSNSWYVVVRTTQQQTATFQLCFMQTSGIFFAPVIATVAFLAHGHLYAEKIPHFDGMKKR